MVGYLTFSSDAQHYVYAATDGRQSFTVVDDREARHRYEAIWTVAESRFLFEGRSEFQYMALKEGRIYLVEERID